MAQMNEERANKLDLHLGEHEFTSYEKARMIGSRALQLAQGAKPLIKISPEEIASINYNPIEIAKREFDAGVIPLSVKRSLPTDRSDSEAEESN